ncbi:PIN domain-containing protein [Dyadobacter psychrotolerans]|uniref:PIN domain-containing protein n=1 Tax=Dyadobacter psychrotolerans TaxID=2541721 RepID=A0A4V2Z3A9_9BACT|nr:PIN domain-containing protein [Dyadobacter psychrotolerans]TDE11998.1 PIN domain-containing protein [Dyadobacter psychrotolerans]
MTSTNVFVDSNVILYLFDKDGAKKEIAERIIAGSPYINSQVLVEVGNVCKKKFGYSKSDIIGIWADLISDCLCVGLEESTMKAAIDLIKRYDFQFFDSIIVASAIEVKCSTLFSEAMQDGLIVSGTLTISNPFN